MWANLTNGSLWRVKMDWGLPCGGKTLGHDTPFWSHVPSAPSSRIGPSLSSNDSPSLEVAVPGRSLNPLPNKQNNCKNHLLVFNSDNRYSHSLVQLPGLTDTSSPPHSHHRNSTIWIIESCRLVYLHFPLLRFMNLMEALTCGNCISKKPAILSNLPIYICYLLGFITIRGNNQFWQLH